MGLQPDTNESPTYCDGAGFALVSAWVSMCSAVHRALYHGGCGRCCRVQYTGEMGLWMLREDAATGRGGDVAHEGYCCDTCGYVRTSGAQVAVDEVEDVPIRTRNINGVAPWTHRA